MKPNKLILLIFASLIIAVVYLGTRLNSASVNDEQIQVEDPEETGQSVQEDCIPTFADGGGPYYQSNSPFRGKIVPEENDGDPLTVEGRVLFDDCDTPVSSAVIDIWQANESGNYEDEWYRGQVRVDEKGNYRFETVVPEGYGSGTGYRPPHIHFKIHLNGREIITSQMFLPEARGREGFEDAYIISLQEQTDDSGETDFNGYHDIVIPTSSGEN